MNSTTDPIEALNDIWPDQPTEALVSPSTLLESDLEGGRLSDHEGPVTNQIPANSSHPQSSPRESLTIWHGSGGEYLVMADLILSGYRVTQAHSGSAYDLLVELDGPRFIRIQVKSTGSETTTRPGTKKLFYRWELRRGNNRNTPRHYANSEYEIVALVATDIREIAYIPKTQIPISNIKLRSPSADMDPQCVRGRINDYPFSQALAEVLK